MGVAPDKFPPPFDSSEYIGPPTDPEDERLEVGVAIVGGGPAGLACANRLMQLLEDEPELTEQLGEVPVAVIEKGKVCGAHLLSGANMRPSAMEELFPDLDKADWPVYQEVTKDAVYLLTNKQALPLKPMPPNFKNHGNYGISVSKVGRFLADKAEEAGAYILTETAADKLLVEDRIVRGVRSGDKGRGKDGQELGNFEPGSDLIAKATVLAEGTLGHLTYSALDYYDLARAASRSAGSSASRRSGRSPSRSTRSSTRWAGRFARAPSTTSSAAASSTRWARTRSASAWSSASTTPTPPSPATTCCRSSRPTPSSRRSSPAASASPGAPRRFPPAATGRCRRSSRCPGMMIAGDAAGMVNVPTLKGVHYAMHAGMYAAEAIVEELKADPESVDFSGYEEKVRGSLIEKELYESRNMRQPFDKGFFVGGAMASAMTVTKGAFPGGHWDQEDDAEHEMTIGKGADNYPAPDGELTFDKLGSVFLSGNATRDDAPNHVRIQTHVPREIAQTWVSMCPAQVYEIPEDQLENGAAEVDVHVTASNCVQCGAITAKGGRLTMPEGGDGPLYQEV